MRAAPAIRSAIRFLAIAAIDMTPATIDPGKEKGTQLIFSGRRMRLKKAASPFLVSELRQALALAERAAAVDRSKYQAVYAHFLFVKGLAEYRQGRFDRAVSAMRGDASTVLGPAPRLVLAMALHRSGQKGGSLKNACSGHHVL
jgi:hypothetical protein